MARAFRRCHGHAAIGTPASRGGGCCRTWWLLSASMARTRVGSVSRGLARLPSPSCRTCEWTRVSACCPPHLLHWGMKWDDWSMGARAMSTVVLRRDYGGAVWLATLLFITSHAADAHERFIPHTPTARLHEGFFQSLNPDMLTIGLRGALVIAMLMALWWLRQPLAAYVEQTLLRTCQEGPSNSSACWSPSSWTSRWRIPGSAPRASGPGSFACAAWPWCSSSQPTARPSSSPATHSIRPCWDCFSVSRWSWRSGIPHADAAPGMWRAARGPVLLSADRL